MISVNRKYIIITPFFPSPENWRGPFVYDQAKAIARTGEYDVVVMKPMAWPKRVEDYEINGIKVCGFRTFEMPSYFFDGLTDGINAKFFLHRLEELEINLQEVAVIHGHTINAAAYGLEARRHNPSIVVAVQHHCLDPITVLNGKWAHWRPNARYRARHAIRVFNEVNLHLSISHAVQDSLTAFPKARAEEVYQPYQERMKQMVGLPAIAPKQMYVLYNGVDMSLFHQEEKCMVDDGLFRIGCIANFQLLKDHMTLLRALARLVVKGNTQYRLSLLGTGEEKQRCLDFIEAHHLESFVEWPEEVSHSDLPAYYHTLGLFVMPSIFEGFGCVYTEAYACGVPFVACKHQGAAELIADDERQYWTIDPQDDEQLARVIEDYAVTRRPQHLKQTIDIDTLIGDYLAHLRENKQMKA